MAELGFSCPSSSSTVTSSGVSVDKVSLVRSGGTFPANTALDINNPGAGWTAVGNSVFFTAAEFVEVTQVYRNGVLQLPGIDAAADNDVYFVAASGTLAFEYDVTTFDVLQIWNFTSTSGS